jgi:hypothetical protein
LSSFGQIPLKDIWAMLDRCAPGYTRKAREHNYVVAYQGRSFPTLPLGKHGKRENPDIQAGHVKQMVRQLQIDIDCVRNLLPQLKLK